MVWALRLQKVWSSWADNWRDPMESKNEHIPDTTGAASIKGDVYLQKKQHPKGRYSFCNLNHINLIQVNQIFPISAVSSFLKWTILLIKLSHQQQSVLWNRIIPKDLGSAARITMEDCDPSRYALAPLLHLDLTQLTALVSGKMKESRKWNRNWSFICRIRDASSHAWKTAIKTPLKTQGWSNLDEMDLWHFRRRFTKINEDGLM